MALWTVTTSHPAAIRPLAKPKVKEEGDVSRAMLYVALTRGRLGTTVLCAPVGQKKAYVDFLVESVREYERLMNAEC